MPVGVEFSVFKSHFSPFQIFLVHSLILVSFLTFPDFSCAQFDPRSCVAGMAGDGGNDCGGLRAAHAGLALSDAEADIFLE